MDLGDRFRDAFEGSGDDPTSEGALPKRGYPNGMSWGGEDGNLTIRKVETEDGPALVVAIKIGCDRTTIAIPKDAALHVANGIQWLLNLEEQ